MTTRSCKHTNLARAASTVESTIEDILDLNNDGVSMLCCGESHQAVAVLSQSLSAMKGFVASQTSTGATGRCCTGGAAANKYQSCCSPPAFPVTDTIEGLEHPSMFIFNRCIAVSSIKHIPTRLMMDHLQLYSTSVVVNLALALHRLGLARDLPPSTTRAYLRKATKMYRMALNLLQTSPMLSASSSCTTTRNLVLSMQILVLNNLATIHYDGMNSCIGLCSVSEDDTRLLRQLLRLLKRTAQEGSVFSEKDIQRFSLNVARWWSQPHSHVAAAAA